jgi:hypothetical protein
MKNSAEVGGWHEEMPTVTYQLISEEERNLKMV